MLPKNFPLTLLLALLPLLLLVVLLGCADTPTEPELTEEEIRQIIAEELAKMQPAADNTLTPQEIAEIALRSTVILDIKKENGKWLRAVSGFVVGEGLIATAYHVIKDMATGSTVRTIGEAASQPIESVITVDEAHDLAILQADVTAPALFLGDSDRVKIGEPIYVTGNPNGYVGTFSVGIVSAIRYDDPLVEGKIIQITAPVSLGSSGGPSLNAKGEVVGVLQGTHTGGQNLNFAIPVNHLKTVLKAIRYARSPQLLEALPPRLQAPKPTPPVHPRDRQSFSPPLRAQAKSHRLRFEQQTDLPASQPAPLHASHRLYC